MGTPDENELYVAQIEDREPPNWAVFQYVVIWAGSGYRARVSGWFWTQAEARDEMLEINERMNARWARRVRLVVGGMLGALALLVTGILWKVLR